MLHRLLFGPRIAVALVVLATAPAAPSAHAAAPPEAPARALPTHALPPAPGRLLATAEADTPVVMNPFTVYVEASRQRIPLKDNPAAVTVVSARALSAMPRGVAPDEVLQGVPGVRIDNQANEERVHISIRGQGVLTEGGIRGIKVLLDDLPLNDPTGVAPDLYDVDWSTVNRVEVQRGPAGAFYGGSGSGGVIDITTRDGGPAPLGGLVSGEAGSFGFYKSLAEGGGRMGQADYRVSASRTGSNGWRQHTAFWSNNFYGKLRWAPTTRADLQGILGWTDHYEENAEGLSREQYETNPGQPNADAIPKNEYYRVDRFTGGLTGRFGVAPGQTLHLTGYYRWTQYMEPRPGEVIRREFDSPGLVAQYDVDHDFGAIHNHLSFGGDAQWQTVHERRRENLGRTEVNKEHVLEGDLLSMQDIDQWAAGGFLLDRVGFARDWTLMVCGRYDAISNHAKDLLSPDADFTKKFERATVRTGLAWAPDPRFNPYANFSTGFLPPATAELANNPDASGGFNSGINRNLTFSRSAGEEVGARGVLPHALSYEVAAFHLATQDDIGRFRLIRRWGIDFYANVGDTRRYGVETRLAWQPVRRLDLEAAYTWSQFKYVAPKLIDGNWLPNSPEHMLNLEAGYEALPGLRVGVQTEMQSGWRVDTRNTPGTEAPGFALWGANASYRWNMGETGGELSLSARNLFGARYLAFTEPDFDNTNDILVSVWNSYQPGSPQEVFVRFTLTR